MDGTWSIDSVCTGGDLTAALNDAMTSGTGQPVPAACDNIFQSASLTGSGTVTFANGNETDSIATTLTASLLYSAACESAFAGTTVTLTASACSTLQTSLTTPTSTTVAFTTAVCSLSGGNCACNVTRQEQSPTTPQSYTVSGGTITYTGANGGSMQYCVSGTTLTAEGAVAGWSVATMTYTAHKTS